MAYRYGNRYQMELLPLSIEEYVNSDDPVRVYDAFVETLNFNELGLALDAHKVGCPEYNPKAMFKLLLYGYSYGFRSSRKLERALYHNVSFIWLMGGLKPDHKTIAEFRRRNKAPLKNVLKTCARLCIRLNLIAGNTLFVDGSKVRANASIKNTWTKEKCERALEKIEARIEAILSECDAVDEYEESQDSLVKMEKELTDKKVLKAKVEKILKPNPENEWVKIEVEPIVDEETFNLVQRIREQNAPQVTNPAVVSSPTLLTGLLEHGHCGSSMTLETGKSGQYRYYNCRKFLRSKSCRGQRVSTELLDKEVLEHITNKLFSTKRLRLLLQEFASDMKSKKKNQNTEETAIRSEIREKEGELENVYLAIRRGIVKQGNVDEVIEELKGEIAFLQSKLNKVQKQGRFRLPPHIFSPKFLERFQLRLKQALNWDVPLAKSYLKLFLKRIRLKGSNVTLVARKDILLNALVRNGRPHLPGVPTAGMVWLPGLDDVDNRKSLPIASCRHPLYLSKDDHCRKYCSLFLGFHSD